MGIEPTSQAWEARILPMNYIRLYRCVHYNRLEEKNKGNIEEAKKKAVCRGDFRKNKFVGTNRNFC